MNLKMSASAVRQEAYRIAAQIDNDEISLEEALALSNPSTVQQIGRIANRSLRCAWIYRVIRPVEAAAAKNPGGENQIIQYATLAVRRLIPSIRTLRETVSRFVINPDLGSQISARFPQVIEAFPELLDHLELSPDGKEAALKDCVWAFQVFQRLDQEWGY